MFIRLSNIRSDDGFTAHEVAEQTYEDNGGFFATFVSALQRTGDKATEK